MNDGIYMFNGKNITMNVCLQIRAIIDLIQEYLQVPFEDAVKMFYLSKTYKTLRETENGLWAESAEYITDRFLEEKNIVLAE